AFARHFEPDYRFTPLRLKSGAIRGRFSHKAPAVNKRSFVLLCCCSLELNLLGLGVVVISQAPIDEVLHCLTILLRFLRLVVGSARPPNLGAFVPIDSEPTEPIEYWGQRLGDIAFLVGVIDSENELAAVPTGKQPVEERRPHAANMQVTGWT